MGTSFVNLYIGDHFLQQFIEGPTHHHLFFCNHAETISDVLTSSSNEHNVPTDHHIIEFSICTTFTKAKPVRRVVNDYSQADFPALRMSCDWSMFRHTGTSHGQYRRMLGLGSWGRTLFYPPSLALFQIRLRRTPTLLPGSMVKFVIWYVKKYTALRNCRKKKTAERKLKLRTLYQQIKYTIGAKHKIYLAKIEASFKEKPKIFWKYHKAILKRLSP
jgi:hypothetical protein